MVIKAASLIFLVPLAANLDRPAFDGTWWVAQTQERRLGFAGGYADCSDTFPKGRLQAGYYGVERYLTRYYALHVDLRSRTLAQVLAAGVPRDPPGAPGGELWSGKHGYFLGEFWSESPKPGQVGFVEGYLVCEQAHGSHEDPGRAAGYASFITAWYNTSGETALAAAKRNDTPIADVLEQAQQSTRQAGARSAARKP